MAKLPARSTSRKVQRQHKRKIQTKKGPREVIVNAGVKKRRPTVRPRTTLTSRPTRDVSTRPALASSPITLRPKKSYVSSKQDLWEKLQEDRQWFNMNLGMYNNNLDELKQALYDDFIREQGENASRQDFEEFKKNLDTTEYEYDYHGGGGTTRVVTFEGSTSPVDEGEYSLFRDDFEGELFKQDTGLELDWDPNKYYGVNLSGGTGFVEEYLNEQTNDLDQALKTQFEGMDERTKNDRKLLLNLIKEKIPFDHVMTGSNISGILVMIPAQYKKQAQDLIKRINWEPIQ